MANTVTLVRATGVLTITAIPINNETVTIGGKVYTYQTTLTDVDGNVLIGADEVSAALNLSRAINLGAGSGSLYAASMVKNDHADVATVAAGVMTVQARVHGIHGNLIDTAETSTVASWAGPTFFTGGSGLVDEFIDSLVLLNQINAEVIAEVLKLTPEAD